MAVSKRTRFEVLRRDDYTCRYCRSTENTLTIDHVVPEALGGGNDPSNLVAACRDCNAGKSSTSPDEHVVAQVAEDAIRWSAARREAFAAMRTERHRFDAELNSFSKSWLDWDKSGDMLPHDWDSSVTHWLKSGLSIDDVKEALVIALGSRCNSRAVFRYMAGVVYNWLREGDRRTSDILKES